MSALGAGPEPITLLRTKLHGPYVGEDIIPRPHLVKRLNRGLNRTLCVTLICGPAGLIKMALMGVVNRLYGLCLPLLSVERLSIIVAVNFYLAGDVMDVVDELNGVRESDAP